jgi:hypothetical protein
MEIEPIIKDCINKINKIGYAKLNDYNLQENEKIELISKIQETDIYFLDITPNKEWIFRKTPKPLSKVWYKQDWAIHLRNAFFTALFSLLVGWLLLLPKSRELNQQYEKLNNRIDSLKILNGLK